MELKKFKKIHFIGIGGIGMSAIAHYFLSNNYNISGYDKVKSEITLKLESKGAEIFYLDDPNLIVDDDKVDLVIYTPAIANSNLQYHQVFPVDEYRLATWLNSSTGKTW